MARKPISKKLRFEVFKRDGFTCQYCGAHPPQALFHIDHIVPVVEGGTNDMDNLVTACDSCNLGKGARSLSAVPESLAKKAEDIAEREEQLRGYHQIIQEKRDRIEREAWDVANIFMDAYDLEGIRKDYLASIRTFLEKLDVFECLDAMEIATLKRAYSQVNGFRYFCGICWNKIREAK